MNDIFWNDAVFDNVLCMVYVVNEQIERLNPLLQTTLDIVPIRGLDNARDDIERKYPFGTSRVPIDVKCDAKVQQGLFCGPLPMVQFPYRQSVKALHDEGRPRTRAPVISKHFVVKAFGLIRLKFHAQKSTRLR
jgi:hypothetical protein